MSLDEIRPPYEILAKRASEQSEVVAVIAPDAESITFGQLYTYVTSFGKNLSALGIGRNTAVAVVLPNGPEIAVALIGVASFAVVTPLSPAFLTEEFTRSFRELEVRAVIVGEVTRNSPAVAVAQAANIPVLCLKLDDPEAGLAGLDGTRYDTGSEIDPAQPQDTAVLVHTSGTTGNPKIIPSIHHNFQTVINSQAKINSSNNLYTALNFLPMWHAIGLANIYGTLLTGNPMLCLPGLDPAKFFLWVEQFKPAGLICVPSMLPTLLTLANENPTRMAQSGLRFIHTGSTASDPALILRVETALGVRIIETYGSTDGGMMTINGTPEVPRRLGSVGKSVGTPLGILGNDGELLPPGQTGEVVVRRLYGMNVYWRNPEANAQAFHNGWFRTGDLGYFDEDGYLFLTGRVRELINRGGEKIAPFEIDQALGSHPAVAEAAAFAMPHPVLGEAVAAAVVLKPDQSVTEPQLRSFLVEQIAYFKIPSKFVFVPEIPRNSTGKVERVKLAKYYGLNSPAQPSDTDSTAQEQEQTKPLAGSVEAEIFLIWSEVLGHSNFGLDNNFFDLGATSLEAASIITLVQERFTRLVTVTNLVEYPTLREFSLAVRRAEPIKPGGPYLTLQTEGSEPPLFTFHGADGYGYHFHDIARLLAPEVPVYAFASIGRPGQELLEFEISTLTNTYFRELRKIQPHGPYRLIGHSSGGWLAFEMAQMLKKQGEHIEFLGMLDTNAPKLKKWYSSLPVWLLRHSPSFVLLDMLASALQPEAYALFSSKVGDGTFGEEHLATMNWLDATWCLWYYLRKKRGKALPPVGKLPGKVIRKVSVKNRTLIWNLSSLFFAHQAREAANYLQAHPEILKDKVLKGLVRAAWQGLHIQGYQSYLAQPYPGEVVIFKAEESSPVVKEEWEAVVQGPVRIHEVKGDHGSLFRMPHAKDITNLLWRYFKPKTTV